LGNVIHSKLHYMILFPHLLKTEMVWEENWLCRRWKYFAEEVKEQLYSIRTILL